MNAACATWNKRTFDRNRLENDEKLVTNEFKSH